MARIAAIPVSRRPTGLVQLHFFQRETISTAEVDKLKNPAVRSKAPVNLLRRKRKQVRLGHDSLL